MLYVYALVDAGPETPLPEEGHAGAPLFLVARGPVAAVCSRHAALDVRVESEDLWRHERVTEALMEERAVLPVRFGTTVADEEALAAMLDERRAEFCDALERVRGRVEIAVRALWSPPQTETDAGADTAAGGPGRAYLLARRHERDAATALAEAIHRPLAARAADAQRQVLLTPRLLLSGAYLVERASVDAFLAAADDAGRRHPEVELLCTGPWPAHTFARATDEGLR